ncbi:MAG TPA: glutamate--tRNA ligase family protein [Gemmatimonadales bacterium]
MRELGDVIARAAALKDSRSHWTTRFAPSPTGELHLGHVLHAQWVWGIAAAFEATVLIRVEDHDRSRCTADFERSILDDLAWLGFEGDAESRASLERYRSPFRQSDHAPRYVESLSQLCAMTDVYQCTCTGAALPRNASGEHRYPGTCRGTPLDGRSGATIRVRIPDDAVTIDDLQLGSLIQHPQEDQGDVAIRDARGQWTYQFCVVVDDLHDGVNLVVRGEDLAASTGRQLLLARMLGRTIPFVTAHHPLIVAPDGRKLSKRNRSDTIRAMRQRGMSRDDVLNAAESALRTASGTPPRSG